LLSLKLPTKLWGICDPLVACARVSTLFIETFEEPRMFRPTLTQVLQQARVPVSLAHLLETLAQCCQRISHAVGRGALDDMLGSHATQNVQGEVQQTLDVVANALLLEAGAAAACLVAMASEEMETLYPVTDTRSTREYLLLFDPLDGSSNIAVNVSIGTIFSILPAPRHGGIVTEKDFLQAGSQQVAAGYAIYGPQTQLVLSWGSGVCSFTLDRATSQWHLTQDQLRIPEQTREFAINMSNQRHWQVPVQRYIAECLAGAQGVLGKDMNMRWVASMVADVHRILNRGGVFLYPRDQRPSALQGKLRLLYEANPMGFLVEQAGGAAINGDTRILALQPATLHERTGVILGSRTEVQRLREYFTDVWMDR